MNQTISYRDKSEMRLLDISQIDIKMMEEEFQSDELVIYVTANDKCIGIITENDFLSHKWRGKELINTKYMSIEEGAIPNILKEKGIRSLPVMSREGNLIG